LFAFQSLLSLFLFVHIFSHNAKIMSIPAKLRRNISQLSPDEKETGRISKIFLGDNSQNCLRYEVKFAIIDVTDLDKEKE